MIIYKDKKVLVYPVLLSGKQGSGKSTTADLVQKYLEEEEVRVVRYKFAQPLYDMHDKVLEVMGSYGIPVPVKDGRLLQLLGTEWGRENYGKDVWVNCAISKYEWLLKAGLLRHVVMLIDDLRFKNELAAFEQGYKVRLECPREVRKARCPAWRETDAHPSEVDLDDSLGLFHDIIDTENLPPATAASMIVRGIKDRFFGAQNV